MIDYFAQLNKRLSRTSFIFILILIEIYFLVNGKAHFPNWGDSYGQLIMIYLLMTVVFLVWAGRETERAIDRPLYQSIGAFVGFAFVTYFLLAFVTALSGSVIQPIAKELFWPTIIIQITVIATSEELIFRGVLLEKFGILISSILFAIWHSYAYSLIYYMPESVGIEVIFSLAIAFFMGVILAIIAKKKEWGLSACVSIHAIYNLFVLGVLISWGGI